jgi:hypothetical protein
MTRAGPGAACLLLGNELEKADVRLGSHFGRYRPNPVIERPIALSQERTLQAAWQRRLRAHSGGTVHAAQSSEAGMNIAQGRWLLTLLVRSYCGP